MATTRTTLVWQALGRAATVLGAIALLTLPGCGGCRSVQTPEEIQKEAEAKKPKPKPKPDFERIELSAQPGERKNPIKTLKPGHWISATVTTKANNFDFSGELDTAATNAQGEPLNLERLPFRLTTSRSATLPKGQARRLEVALFVPRGSSSSWITTHLRDRQTGREAKRETEPFKHMASHEYFLLGLVREPDRYRYLSVLNSVRPPRDEMANDEQLYYRVQLPRIGQSVPLPSDSLCWTSMAYVVWDDVEPTVLNTEQQQALVDWLHWGGQLIISGPKSLDLLQHSFLEPYLPAVAGQPLKLNGEVLDELNTYYTVAPGRGPARQLAVSKLWSGIRLDKQPAAEFVAGTGELVAERRVGRGRIVVTAFRLTERDLLNWPSFDSFFNACLLRRPERTFTISDADLVRMDWAGQNNRRFDPALVSQVRYFSRDALLPGDSRAPRPELRADPAADPATQSLARLTLPTPYSNNDELEATAAKSDSGVAGWNDFGPVATAARRSLKQAAGISIPQRSFVLKVLGLYLVVLVPLNWCVFWLLGRVEWAWVAAPFIAIVCAVSVVWLAQLDIGFARSSTEIAVVELYGGYSRAHVTRYTALYTSLSTTYAVHIDQPSALALPFATDPKYALLSGQQRSNVVLRRDTETHLTNYAISSNATGMIHSEHMAELQGAVTLEERPQQLPRVSNTTRLRLIDAGVMRRPDDSPDVELAWVGYLAPGDAAPLVFAPADDGLFARERERSPLTEHNPSPETLSLRSLFELAEDPAQLEPGDARLVAWLEGDLAGVRIEPAASQERHATLVLVNLQRGAAGAPQPDRNLPAQLKRTEDDLPVGVDAASTPDLFEN